MAYRQGNATKKAIHTPKKPLNGLTQISSKVPIRGACIAGQSLKVPKALDKIRAAAREALAVATPLSSGHAVTIGAMLVFKLLMEVVMAAYDCARGSVAFLAQVR